MSRVIRYFYRPDLFVPSEPEECEDILATAREQRNRIYNVYNTEEDNARVRAHISNFFRDNPISFFLKWDMNELVHESRDKWAADMDSFNTLAISVQFILFKVPKVVRAISRGGARNGQAVINRPTDEDVMRETDKNVTFYFERVMDSATRQRQLGARQHSKARTFIDLFVEIYNFNPKAPITREMYSELMSARRSLSRSSGCDNQLLGIVKMVTKSIMKGERKYCLVVYDIMLGKIGATYAPNTHKYLTDVFLPQFENATTESTSAMSDREDAIDDDDTEDDDQ